MHPHLTAPALPKLKILLVDDSSDDRLLVRRELERSFDEVHVEEAGSPEDFERVVECGPFHAVITDYNLGWNDGITLLERIRARWPDVATVVFTGTGTEEVAVQAMKGGVDDYVTKSPREVRRLPLAVKRAMERSRQREALVSAEKETRDLLERLPAGIYRSALGGALLYGNPAFLELFGVTDRAAPLGSDLRDYYIDPHGRERWLAMLEAEDVALGEFETRSPNGGTRWIRNHGRLVRGADGRPRFIEGVVEDVTQQKRAEEETEKRGRYLSLLQSVTSIANENDSLEVALEEAMEVIAEQIGWPVAHLFSVSEDGETIESTDVWMHLDGQSRDGLERGSAGVRLLPGEGLIGRAHSTSRPEWMADLALDRRSRRSRAAIRYGLSAAIAVPIVAGSRSVAIIEFLHTEPTPEEPGLLEALYQAGIQLGRVAERQAALEERARIEVKATRAQKMEAVGRLAGGIAHDFNNLITVLLMESRSAQGIDDLPDEAQRALRSIFETSERAALLTRQLLSFSKGKPEKATPIEVGDVVGGLLPMLQRIIGEAHTLEGSISDDSSCVRMDQTELEQVIANLVVNARDAMPDGGRIAMSVARRAVAINGGGDARREMDAVVLNVSDEGEGIPADVREAIFEPFFSTKGEHGTGLGLSICYGIVAAAGGELRVYSEEGVGTTFSVVLPTVDGGSPDSVRPETPADLPTGTETILIVEDEEAVRRVTVRALEAQGYTTIEAGDAEGALAHFGEENDGPSIDLVLADVVLPGRGGVDLVTQLRRTHPEVAAILASGYGEELVRSQLDQHAEETVIIQKPFSITELASKVRTALDERGTDDS